MGAAWTNEGADHRRQRHVPFIWGQLGLLALPRLLQLTPYGYDYFGANNAWLNSGTITTTGANVYLGGWLSYNPAADNLATLDLSQDTVYLIGTLDNSPADDPSTDGVLTLAPGITSTRQLVSGRRPNLRRHR